MTPRFPTPTRSAARALAPLLLLLACLPVLAIDPIELSNPALQARYRELTHELRCMQCQNQAIADSPVGLAGDLRREVRELLLAGKTDDEVRDYMVARYGEFILFRPRDSARNIWLWWGPGILLLAGAVLVARVVRARGALVDRDTEPVDEDVSRS